MTLEASCCIPVAQAERISAAASHQPIPYVSHTSWSSWDSGAGVGLAYWSALLAELFLRERRPEEASQALDDALHHVAKTDERWDEPEVYRLKAKALFEMGDHDLAEQYFRKELVHV